MTSIPVMTPAVLVAISKIRAFADSARQGADKARVATDKAAAFASTIAKSDFLTFLEKVSGMGPVANGVIYAVEAIGAIVDTMDSGIDAVDAVIDALDPATVPVLPQAGA